MDITLRQAQQSDMEFMQDMLYEAVFWRPNPQKPAREEALAMPGVKNALIDWQERPGDVAVIALVGSNQAGAAWYRFYSDSHPIRGFIKATIPVLVIAVQREYRRLGIGAKMAHWLIHHAGAHKMPGLSLMVSKDNHAIHLYRKCGFVDYDDQEDSLLMIHHLKPTP